MKICGSYSCKHLPRVRMDYAQFTENEQEIEGEQGSLSRAEESLTMLVMHEDATTSIWSYAVEHKGAGEDWLIGQIARGP